MLESLLPPGVHGVEGPILLEEWDVTAEERAHAAAFVAKRHAEFLTGRTYVRRALRSLGVPAPTLAANEDRSPMWPEGVVGCITHTTGHCAAVAARGTLLIGLGLDMEVPGRINEAVAQKTFTEGEMRMLVSIPEPARQARMSAMFCAKEAFYKLQFPLTKAWVGFHDVTVALEGGGHFELGLLKTIGWEFTKGRAFTGRYVIGEGLVGALMAI